MPDRKYQNIGPEILYFFISICGAADSQVIGSVGIFPKIIQAAPETIFSAEAFYLVSDIFHDFLQDIRAYVRLKTI